MSSPRIEIDLPSVLAEFAKAEQLPGATLAIVQTGHPPRIACAGSIDRAGGPPVDGRTRFRIASMTKCFTALAVLASRDAGRLRLDDPVADHYPLFASVVPPTADAAPVTLRDLLAHRAGYVTDDPWADRLLGLPEEGFARLVSAGWPFARPPGIAYEYSNLGYAILGQVIAAAAGRPYVAFVRDTLLAPLGMDATGFVADAPEHGVLAVGHALEDGTWRIEPPEPDGAFGAMGGLVSTAEDYARFVAFLLSAWPPRDDPDDGPVRRASVRELTAGHGFPERAGETPESGAFTYGGGMLCVADAAVGRFLTHSGGLPGYGSNVLIVPDSGFGVFGLANRTYAPMHKLTHAVARLARAAIKPRPEPVSDAIREAVGHVVAALGSGGIATLGGAAADSLFRDRSASSRDQELAAITRRFGALSLGGIEARHALAARFVLTGAGGEVSGALILTPEPRPRIQSLAFTIPPE